MARKLRIKQVRSKSGHTEDMAATLRALGLRRNQHEVEKNDSPQVRGMVYKVRHLVRVEELD